MSSPGPVRRGPLAWMAVNSVAANLLMMVVMIGGLLIALSLKQEVFPEFEAELISVTVPYRGAAPEEVEEAVCIRIEEALQGLRHVVDQVVDDAVMAYLDALLVRQRTCALLWAAVEAEDDGV